MIWTDDAEALDPRLARERGRLRESIMRVLEQHKDEFPWWHSFDRCELRSQALRAPAEARIPRTSLAAHPGTGEGTCGASTRRPHEAPNEERHGRNELRRDSRELGLGEGLWIRGRLLLLLLVVSALAGCQQRLPAPTPLLGLEKKTPVVFVPGVTGSKLRNRETGSIAFGLGWNVLLPHDGGYGIALPVSAAGESELEAFGVVDRVTFAFQTVEVFGPLVELLEKNGYRVGDLDDPRPGDTFFPFAYDWRRDATETARVLSEKLERLRRVRGDERLPVALICQSTGAHVCRYLVKYGGASLDLADAGRAGPLPWLRVTRVILMSTSNGGSMRTLRELNRGRRYVRFGRFLEPEVFFTFRSLYQDVPCLRRDLFVDARGTLLDVDLCDPASWERYGWSVYGAAAVRRLERARRRDLFGSAAESRRYLRHALERAKRFQRLLRRDPEGFGSTLYFLIQDVSRDTPDRAVLVGEDGAWRTLFTGDEEVDRQQTLRERVTAAGDGHATRASQLWLSPLELAAMPRPPFYVEGGHFELIHDPHTAVYLLDALDERRYR